MSHRLPAVLSPDDLPVAELCAARLDGDLFAIADCYTPVDLPDRAVSRAQALAGALSVRVIVEQNSAAWVFGVTDAMPMLPQFCSTADARAKPAAIRRLTVREVVIDDDEILNLGGVRVTSPLRTASDLARVSTEFDASTQLVVLRLLELARASVDDCIGLLERRRNLPGKRRTLERLRSLSVSAEPGSAVAHPIHVIDGIDSPHSIQHAIEVGGVPHFENELAEREPVGRSGDRGRENIDVML
jgi:hypothetical protein